MKIMITGANGYIGQHVVNKLICLKHEVTCVDIKFDNLSNEINVKKIKRNIFNDDIKNLYFEANKPDVLLHLAWLDGFNLNSDLHIKMISSHYAFIEEMVNQGIKKICVMGSMHEVGYHEGMISENTKSHPTNLYGISKYMLREALTLLCEKKNVIFQWTRAYYITGNDFNNNSIFKKIIEAADSGQKKFPFTKGTHKFDFLDINQLANQICCVILQSEINGIIDVCSGKPISLAEKVKSFIYSNKLHIELEYGVYPERDDESPIVYGDAKKINLILKNQKREVERNIKYEK